MQAGVITAVLNEETSIHALFDALSSQTRLPEVVIIVDGGSTDGTIEAVEAHAQRAPFRVELLRIPGKIAVARNAAVRSTACDAIAVTDADCIPVPNWLESLLAPIERADAAAVAGGYYTAASDAKQRAIATFTWVPVSPQTRRFLPSHRSVAYLRSVWEAIGGYDEEIDSGEDTAFDLQVEKRFPFAIAPDALVAWRPRSTVTKALWQQIFYGAGDGQARIQLGYHALVAAFTIAEVGFVVARGRAQFACGAVVGTGITYFAVKHARLFGRMFPDLAWVTLLTIVLPPARLLGFTIGACGGSVRGMLKRS